MRRAGSGAIGRAVIQAEMRDLRDALFSRDALMKRHAVVLAEREEDAEPANPAGQDQG